MLLNALIHTTTLLSGIGVSYEHHISGDGRYVVASADNAKRRDVFVIDTDSGAIDCPSCDIPGQHAWATGPTISSNGRFVVYMENPGGGAPDVAYCFDRVMDTRTQLLAGTAGPIISGDGRWIVYTAGNDLWIRNRRVGTDELVVSQSEGVRSVSETGRFIVYAQSGHDYVIDRETGISEEIDDGSTTSYNVRNYRVSEDGRYFLNSTPECLTLLYDRALGTTDCFTGGYSDISADGRFVVATVYVGPEGAGNQVWDRELGGFARAMFGYHPSICRDGSRVVMRDEGQLILWTR